MYRLVKNSSLFGLKFCLITDFFCNQLWPEVCMSTSFCMTYILKLCLTVVRKLADIQSDFFPLVCRLFVISKYFFSLDQRFIRLCAHVWHYQKKKKKKFLSPFPHPFPRTHSQLSSQWTQITDANSNFCRVNMQSFITYVFICSKHKERNAALTKSIHTSCVILSYYCVMHGVWTSFPLWYILLCGWYCVHVPVLYSVWCMKVWCANSCKLFLFGRYVQQTDIVWSLLSFIYVFCQLAGVCWFYIWANCTDTHLRSYLFFFFFFFLLPAQAQLSITGRNQTGYTVHAGFCMFPQSCDLRTETAGSL
jgi:hypothetical protein